MLHANGGNSARFVGMICSQDVLSESGVVVVAILMLGNTLHRKNRDSRAAEPRK